MTPGCDESRGRRSGARSDWRPFVAVAVGVVAFATGLGGGDSPRTFAALIASWLFFAGLAAGALAFRAFFRIVDAAGRGRSASRGAASAGFAPVALVVLVVILAGAGRPVAPRERGPAWLRVAASSAARELGLDRAALRCRRLLLGAAGGTRPPAAPSVLLLALAVVLSVWAFDFVLGAGPDFESTLIGPYRLHERVHRRRRASSRSLGLVRGELSEAQRRDAGAWSSRSSIFWAYLFWSQYLTIWYGNLPDEVGFALRRAQGGWGAVVLAVVGLVFAVPFVMLLQPARAALVARARRGARRSSCRALAQLPPPGRSLADARAALAVAVRDVLIALGMLGAFALSSVRRTETALAPA